MNTDSLPDLGFDWAEILTMIQTTGVDLGINLITAIVIFFVGKWIVNLIVKGMLKAMQTGDMDITLRRFIANLARMLLMLFVIIAAINQLGVQTASLIALLGAAGLAVGLALQGSLSNFAAGVLIVLFRPYKVGDWIEGGGVSGAVEEVQILSTVLKTGDNKRIIVPNSQIMGTTITNYSANETRRVDLVEQGHDRRLPPRHHLARPLPVPRGRPRGRRWPPGRRRAPPARRGGWRTSRGPPPRRGPARCRARPGRRAA